MRLELGRLGFAWTVVLALGAGACGAESAKDGDADDDDGTVGPSGVPSNKYLDELSPAELEQLCPWWALAKLLEVGVVRQFDAIHDASHPLTS